MNFIQEDYIYLYRSRRVLISDKRLFSDKSSFGLVGFLLINSCCSIKRCSERFFNASNARF
jgi:hypothetical protein